VDEARVRAVVADCEKQRFEIEGDRIRARYGHSVPQRVTYPPVEPPPVLYHGTSRAALPAIRREGLRAMRRQYVHLSTTPEQALAVGRRHDPAPVLLTLRAHAAWQAGAAFHQPEPRLFLTDAIPPEFIQE
jgi:putative RNA 2'-phosphotransferase